MIYIYDRLYNFKIYNCIFWITSCKNIICLIWCQFLIWLSFAWPYLKKTNNCFHFRNGGYSDSPLYGRFCGSSVRNPIISHSNSIWLRFHSDSSSSATGFQLFFDGTSTGKDYNFCVQHYFRTFKCFRVSFEF